MPCSRQLPPEWGCQDAETCIPLRGLDQHDRYCLFVYSEVVLGKSVEEASKISEPAVADALGGIPEYKMRCSNLAVQAIRKAVEDCRSRAVETDPR
jgi:hypothetical protein